MIGVPNYFCDRVDNVICNCNSGKVASLNIIILLLLNFVEQVNNTSIHWLINYQATKLFSTQMNESNRLHRRNKRMKSSQVNYHSLIPFIKK